MTYKIVVAGWLNDKFKFTIHYYNDKQEAVNTVTEALERNGLKFSIVKEGNKTSFLNESGGVLAEVVPHQPK